MLIVQVVEILWTKATRGAPRSNERVGLARGFAIAPGSAECLVQHHRMAEWEGFSPKVTRLDALATLPDSIDVLGVTRENDDAFSLGILGTPDSGQPTRRPTRRALRLLPGQWARLVINARHASHSGQWYSETVFNATCGPEVISDRFLRGEPDHELDLKADLF